MHCRSIALYVTETMADWEYAYLTAQITVAERMHPGRFELLLVGDGLEPARSQGGMPVTPTADLGDLSSLRAEGALAALVIPGGDHYHAGHERLIATVREMLTAQVPVAAICGATYVLARAGVLDERRHTSNSSDFLAASGYRGADRYVDAVVVSDRGVTTASGLNAVPFTAEVMRVTELFPGEVADAWERLYSTGDARYYGAWAQAVDAWARA
ncbi:DJ-1/PfpI family protein [Actinomyces ruminicola]|uniref:DJ-1/PfpI family protein n=1 Tax=Actinomyces ruminicola TaxID=332524 RepID=A0A1G9XWS4_9ACTO|nr:DJ-1/PfpI family protein [Actinomyces ruminicola]SDN00595.1 DJ-1/PfpI family protein [Actinomyces ruminicola]